MKTCFMALAMLTLGAATAASATETENPFARDKAILQLGGIDLSTADGQQRLAIRMDAAARSVCGDNLASVHLALDAQARDCRAQVVADIRNQIEARQAAVSGNAKVRLASAL